MATASLVIATALGVLLALAISAIDTVRQQRRSNRILGRIRQVI
jgi:hypothetical protein